MPPVTQAAQQLRDFQIGPWRVSPRSGEIRKPGTIHHPQPKVMEVLVYLAQRPGQIISKSQLLEDLWPQPYVTEHVLWRSIARLRRLLGDDPKAPSFIETRPKLGYRLIAPVSPLDAIPPSRDFDRRKPWLLLALAALTLLLTFEAVRWEISGSGTEQSAGSAALETASELREAGLDHYRRYTWSDNTKAIQLLERASDLEPQSAATLAALANAYAINWGRYASALSDRRWVIAALETAQQAVALDPLLPQAYKALGMAYASSGHPRQAAEAYRRALELNPDHGNSLNNLAHSEGVLGRLDKALELQSRAVALEPSNPIFATTLGELYLVFGDFARARKFAEQALAAQANHSGGLSVLLALELTEGRIAEAVAIGKRVVKAHPRHTYLLQLAAAAEQLEGRPEVALDLLNRATADSVPGGLGAAVLRKSHVLWQLGDFESASTIHRNYQRWIDDAQIYEDSWRSAYWAAAVHAIRGEKAESVQWMEKAIDGGFINHWKLRWDPIFSDVIHDPGYQRVVGALVARTDEMKREVMNSDLRG